MLSALNSPAAFRETKREDQTVCGRLVLLMGSSQEQTPTYVTSHLRDEQLISAERKSSAADLKRGGGSASPTHVGCLCPHTLAPCSDSTRASPSAWCCGESFVRRGRVRRPELRSAANPGDGAGSAAHAVAQIHFTSASPFLLLRDLRPRCNYCESDSADSYI